MAEHEEVFLRFAPLFAGLSEAELDQLAAVARPFSVPEGALIFRQGERSDGMYVIREGRVSVRVHVPGDELLEINTAAAGSILGELALVDRGPRSASAYALEPTRGWFLGRDRFEALRLDLRPAALRVMGQLALVIAKRVRWFHEQIDAALAVQPGAGDAPPPAEPRMPPTTGRERLPGEATLRALPLFERLEGDDLAAFLARGELIEVERGTPLLPQGRPGADALVVVRGALRTTQWAHGRREHLAVDGPGRLVGELALVDGLPQPATCTAQEASTLLRLRAERFHELRNGNDPLGFAFSDFVLHTLVGTLRRGGRTMARLAAEGRVAG